MCLLALLLFRNFLIIRLLSVIKRCADLLTPNKKGCTELDTTRDSKLLFKCKMSKSKFVEFSKVSNFLLAKTELNHQKIMLSSVCLDGFHAAGQRPRKVRVRKTVAVQYINITTGKCCSIAFICIITVYDLIHRLAA